MIAPYRVVWQSVSSIDYDLSTNLSFGNESGATSSFLNKQSVVTEHYDGSYRRIHSYKYTDVLTPRITFIKQDFSEFTFEENRQMLSWLTSRDSADWLEIYHDDSNVMSYRLYGNFISVEQHKLSTGHVIGYECEFESSSPYAWSRKMIYPEVAEVLNEIGNPQENNDYLTVSETAEFDVTCNSDEYNKLTFPQVTITFSDKNDDMYFNVDTDPMYATDPMMPDVIYDFKGSLYVNIDNGYSEDSGVIQISGKMSIDTEASATLSGAYYYFPEERIVAKSVRKSTNADAWEWKTVSVVGAMVQINNTYVLNGKTVPKKTIIAGGSPNETIVLDGMNKVIYSTKSNEAKRVGDAFNWEWPSLIAGKNHITITGNCKIKFEWLEPRKIGSM